MVTATPYNNPPNPGPIPPRPSAVFPKQWEDTKAAHKRALDEHNSSNNFDKAIKQQIIKAIQDPIFLKSIENHIGGFSRVAARQCSSNFSIPTKTSLLSSFMTTTP
jgi:hypothetical protein